MQHSSISQDNADKWKRTDIAGNIWNLSTLKLGCFSQKLHYRKKGLIVFVMY